MQLLMRAGNCARPARDVASSRSQLTGRIARGSTYHCRRTEQDVPGFRTYPSRERLVEPVNLLDDATRRVGYLDNVGVSGQKLVPTRRTCTLSANADVVRGAPDDHVRIDSFAEAAIADHLPAQLAQFEPMATEHSRGQGRCVARRWGFGGHSVVSID